MQSCRTAPSPVPPRGYLVTVASVNISDTAPGTSHTLTIYQPGVHTIQVQPLSRHYPSEAMSVVVVKLYVQYFSVLSYYYYAGILLPVVSIPSLTATSVTVSWTQPKFSLPVYSPVHSITDTSHWKWPSTLSKYQW